MLSIARQQAGKSLLLVSGGDVETTIKDIPGVTSAKAIKHLPNSLEVTIKAQKPAAMLKTSEGTMTAVDSRDVCSIPSAGRPSRGFRSSK